MIIFANKLFLIETRADNEHLKRDKDESKKVIALNLNSNLTFILINVNQKHTKYMQQCRLTINLLKNCPILC